MLIQLTDPMALILHQNLISLFVEQEKNKTQYAIGLYYIASL